MTQARRVFITSDWHLGGTLDAPATSGAKARLGSQICRSATELGTFIDWVRSEAEQPGAPLVELVINGDMVDFLAPDATGAAKVWIGDETEVLTRLDEIVKSTPAPFEALRRLLQCPRCSLTILLGNHDVELCLPQVRRHLQVEILGSDGQGLELLFNGEACTRGRLLIEHGNRYDQWNQVKYNDLRQECSQRSRGLPVLEKDREQRWFNPPAGTMLVVYAVNRLLGKYPFINLLKPESGAMLPLLLSLQPELRPILTPIIKFWKIYARHRGAKLAGPATPSDISALGGDNAGSRVVGSLDAVLAEQIGEENARRFYPPPSPNAGSGLGGVAVAVNIYERLRQRTTALSHGAQNLASLGRAGWAESSVERRAEVRVALGRLAGDRGWDTTQEADPTYEKAARELVSSGQFSHVVFGHTHFPKEIPLSREGFSPGCYLNAGAWADVIRLPLALAEEGAAAESALEQFILQIENGDLSTILVRYAGFAEVDIEANGDVQSAQIFSYGGPGRERLPPLTPLTVS